MVAGNKRQGDGKNQDGYAPWCRRYSCFTPLNALRTKQGNRNGNEKNHAARNEDIQKCIGLRGDGQEETGRAADERPQQNALEDFHVYFFFDFYLPILKQKEAQTFAIRLSAHHKPLSNMGKLRPVSGQLQY